MTKDFSSVGMFHPNTCEVRSGGAEAWLPPHGDTFPPFGKPGSGRISVKVSNHFLDEVMTMFGI